MELVKIIQLPKKHSTKILVSSISIEQIQEQLIEYGDNVQYQVDFQKINNNDGTHAGYAIFVTPQLP